MTQVTSFVLVGLDIIPLELIPPSSGAAIAVPGLGPAGDHPLGSAAAALVVSDRLVLRVNPRGRDPPSQCRRERLALAAPRQESRQTRVSAVRVSSPRRQGARRPVACNSPPSSSNCFFRGGATNTRHGGGTQTDVIDDKRTTSRRIGSRSRLSRLSLSSAQAA